MTNNYYQKHKERLKKEARESYQNLYGEKKKKKDIKKIDIKVPRKILKSYWRREREKVSLFNT